jgi:branched-chain amino acid transport system ATP-binding protein
MKAFRGQPSIFAADDSGRPPAELAVDNITLTFGGVTALANVGLTVHTGELVSIIGPNGAGKTSLLNSITGYYHPQTGRISFNGEDITGLPPHAIVRQGIGRTFQNIELFPGMTVLANMLLARHMHSSYNIGLATIFAPSVRKEEVRHRKVLEELIDFLEMQPIRKKPVGALPYGLRKRVELARALALKPKLLVLDEPFAGMTLEEKEDMVRFLIELNGAWGQTMILVEHDMSIVMSISHRIMVLDFGVTIAEGLPEEVANHPGVVKAYLGEATTV